MLLLLSLFIINVFALCNMDVAQSEYGTCVLDATDTLHIDLGDLHAEVHVMYSPEQSTATLSINCAQGHSCSIQDNMLEISDAGADGDSGSSLSPSVFVFFLLLGFFKLDTNKSIALVITLAVCLVGVSSAPGRTVIRITLPADWDNSDPVNISNHGNSEITVDDRTGWKFEGGKLRPICDLATFQLRSIPVMYKEHGLWTGEYTLLGPDGNGFVSSSWEYDYLHYRGYIQLWIEGKTLWQRNVFLYPPKGGQGSPGQGSEKIFEAKQDAISCDGTLAGPFQGLWTVTHSVDDYTVLYQVQAPTFGIPIWQNQLTTFTGNGEPNNTTRTRAATGMSFPPPGVDNYQSYYREKKVDCHKWKEAIRQTRIDYNIPPMENCRWNGTAESSLTCQEFFGELPFGCFP